MPQSTYAPNYLVHPSTKNNDGVGPVIELGALRGQLLVITLGVNHVIEQEDLAISIWGSASETTWGTKPLLSFPRKSYCGVYTAFLNLARYPTVRFLCVGWKMRRQDTRDSRLLFGFSVSLEESNSPVIAAVA